MVDSVQVEVIRNDTEYGGIRVKLLGDALVNLGMANRRIKDFYDL